MNSVCYQEKYLRRLRGSGPSDSETRYVGLFRFAEYNRLTEYTRKVYGNLEIARRTFDFVDLASDSYVRNLSLAR